METYISQQTEDCPEIILDKEMNKFLIRGKSLPEDVASFYTPVLDWLQDYAQNPNSLTTFDIKLSYFNTASSKLILDILMILEEMCENGHPAEINWHYPEYDEDMKDAGLEYSEMVNLKFNHLPYPGDKIRS